MPRLRDHHVVRNPRAHFMKNVGAWNRFARWSSHSVWFLAPDRNCDRLFRFEEAKGIIDSVFDAVSIGQSCWPRIHLNSGIVERLSTVVFEQLLVKDPDALRYYMSLYDIALEDWCLAGRRLPAPPNTCHSYLLVIYFTSIMKFFDDKQHLQKVRCPMHLSILKTFYDGCFSCWSTSAQCMWRDGGSSCWKILRYILGTHLPHIWNRKRTSVAN